MAFDATYDACVLHPAGLRDLLVRLATTGHGNWWTKCHIDDCDLHITRPGYTDCHREFCHRTLRSSRTGEYKYVITLPNKEQHQ